MPAKGEPVHDRHHQVQDDRRRQRTALEQRQRVGTVRPLDHVVPLVPQYLGKGFPDRGIVVDYQNERHASALAVSACVVRRSRGGLPLMQSFAPLQRRRRMALETEITAGRAGDPDKTIDTLNKFLRGELSAAETYGQALERLRGGAFDHELEECKRSHEERAEMLRQQVVRLGGEPSESSGPWGGFARLVEGGAKLFGPRVAVSALEEGEDHGLRLYRDHLADLESSARELCERTLLPEQERTHRTLSGLQHRFH
jgi:hypothetical protein